MRDFSDFFHLNPYKLARSFPIANATNHMEGDRTTSGHLQERKKAKKDSALRGDTIVPERKNTYIPFYFYIANTFALAHYYLLNCRDM